MTDLMDRLASANPAGEQDHPPIDGVWRKIAAADPPAAHRPWRRAGHRALLIAAAAVPVIAVILVAISTHGMRHASSRPGVNRDHHPQSTIQPAVQRSAQRALSGRTGSVVVMNPQTGAIEAMAATGSVRGGVRAAVAPGATFDVVTLATALASGRYGSHSLVSGASPFGIAGSRVRNDQGQSFGRITLADALTFSVNTVFARVGARIGAGALTREMRLFELSPQPVGGGKVALGRLAAGQGAVLATPLQLAAIAAAIANGGRLAQPHSTNLHGPAPQHTVMPARVAGLLTQMLRRVVTQGTGTAANLPALSIAGKTGTATAGTDGGHRGTVATFIGFAPADHPTVAIAVVLSAPPGGFGGTDAAPIAARVIRDALRGRP